MYLCNLINKKNMRKLILGAILLFSVLSFSQTKIISCYQPTKSIIEISDTTITIKTKGFVDIVYPITSKISKNNPLTNY